MSARNVVWNMIYLGRYCLSYVKRWQLLQYFVAIVTDLELSARHIPIYLDSNLPG